MLTISRSKASATPPTPEELARAVESAMVQFFNSTRDGLGLTNQQIFAGIKSGEPDKLTPFVEGLRKAGAKVPDNLHPIAQILGSGAFVAPGNNVMKDTIQAGFKLIKQQLVGVVLSLQKVAVFQNTNGVKSGCDKIPGSRWIDNSCFTLKLVEIDEYGIIAQKNKDLPKEVVLKLDDPKAGYNIDLNTLYTNARDCNNEYQTTHEFSFDGDFPRCAFGIGFIKAKDDPCHMDWPGPPNFEFAVCGADYCQGNPKNPLQTCGAPQHEDYWNEIKHGVPAQVAQNPKGTRIVRI